VAFNRELFRELVDRAQLMEELPNLTPELIQSFPGLAWVKEYHPDARSYTMVLLSDEYVRTLLGPTVLQYIGKTDFDIWPHEVAGRFYENDERARTGDAIWCEEPFRSPLTGKHGIFRGAKWSFTSHGVTYVAGVGENAKPVEG
jgi:hypothetical protein